MSAGVTQAKWGTTLGNTGFGLTLTPTDWVELNPPQVLGTNTPLSMVAYEFHFWINVVFAPPATAEMKMVHMELTNGQKTMEVDFSLKPDANGKMFATFVTQVVQDNDPPSNLPHYEEIVPNKWYHLIATLQNNNMKVTIDGRNVKFPISTRNQDAFKRFTIPKVLVGAQAAGINGVIDQFHIDDLSQSGTTTDIEGECTDSSTVSSSIGFITCKGFVENNKQQYCTEATVNKGCCLACQGIAIIDTDLGNDVIIIGGGAAHLTSTFWFTLAVALVSIVFSGWY